MTKLLPTSTRKIIKRLSEEGWELNRIKGDHHIFVHPDKPNLAIVPHPKKDLPIGTLRDIYKVAGWK